MDLFRVREGPLALVSSPRVVDRQKVFQYREKYFSILTFFVRHTKETSVYTQKWIRACVSFAPFSIHLAVFC